ncbi:cRISPR-associated protein Csm2 family [Clostridium sp. CAG:122]|uniref:type III-A CRISPR-associated protein Csm2 n=1 Tax=Butyribacter TaxID=2822463 RepID=UPI000340D6EF|nr:type III-A CRISPR-associated protein Csm2 [Roseburia hominis]CCZ41133.1 cRISPR-associated protein Csm2 family [Clostridium sp. CAG:122]
MVLEKTNYVDMAENAVKRLERNKNGNLILTTSKIRNILSMISTIYNEVIHHPADKLNEDMVERLKYLKMRFAYEAGREKAVKNLIEVAKIFEIIEWVGDDKQRCILFCKYMESIVAYHKFNGGKD